MLASKGPLSGGGNKGSMSGNSGLLKEDLGAGLREGSDGETSDYQRSTPSPRDADDMVMELNSEGELFPSHPSTFPLSHFGDNLTNLLHLQLWTSWTVLLHLRHTGEQKHTSLTLDSSTVQTRHPPPRRSPTRPPPPPRTPPSWTATSPPRWRASPPSPPPPPSLTSS